MDERPLYQDIVEEAEAQGATEAMRQNILRMLEIRFGDEAEGLKVELDAVEYDRLEELFDQAMICPSPADFRERLLSG